MIFFGEGSLRKGIDEFVLHYQGASETTKVSATG